MSPLTELSAAVRSRRTDMGLTQAVLARLSGLSRATVNQVETGCIKDLSLMRSAKLLGVLGLSMRVSAVLPQSPSARGEKTPALDLAARTASVSYKRPLSGDDLRAVLMSGDMPPRFTPHLNALLEDAPVSLLASMVEQLHQEENIDRGQVWQRMRELAATLKSRRDIWQ